MARIYVASSWRNPYQPHVVSFLTEHGHHVYDFRSDIRAVDPSVVERVGLGSGPPPATAFAWSEMDEQWKDWEPAKYRYLLQTHPRAAQGYVGDLRGMEWADTCVLCLPCGNSAHIEAGYMKGLGKRLIIYWETNDRTTVTPEKQWKFEPDLMYLLADNLVIGRSELLECLSQ
jgi:hypothetical protein